MRRVAIVQARTGSTRLPGKVLLDLAGRPMLVQQLRRLQRCRRLDEIVVATTTHAADDALAAVVAAEGVRAFRGSEADVLSRYVEAARESRAELVVRVTADCPLIDPDVVDRVIGEAEDHADDCDYASNVIERTYPRGLDAEAVYADVLRRVDRLARSGPAREHVTLLIVAERPELFLRRSVTGAVNHSDLRWTVDTPADLAMVRRVYEELDLGDRFCGYEQILAYVLARPEVTAINAHIPQKAPRPWHDRG